MTAQTCPKCRSDLVEIGVRGNVHCLACGHTNDTTKEK